MIIGYILTAILFLGLFTEIKDLRKRISILENDQKEYFEDLPYYKSDYHAGKGGIMLGQKYRLDYNNDYKKEPHTIKIRLL